MFLLTFNLLKNFNSKEQQGLKRRKPLLENPMEKNVI